MTTAEFLTFIGLVISLGLGIWNLYQTRRTQFINTVTSERVKWIQELRKNISALTGAIHTWTLTYKGARSPEECDEERKLLAEIDRLRYLVRLQLNPKDDPDKEIEQIIITLSELSNATSIDPVLDALEELTKKTQILLKKEWEKVKDEAAKDLFQDNYKF